MYNCIYRRRVINIRNTESGFVLSSFRGGASFIGLVVLLFATRADGISSSHWSTGWERFMFLASGIYHAQKREEDSLNVWRKLTMLPYLL